MIERCDYCVLWNSGASRPDPPEIHRDAVEGKLFGIGAESYTVGSNEFYLAYAASRKIMLCLTPALPPDRSSCPTSCRRRWAS